MRRRSARPTPVLRHAAPGGVLAHPLFPVCYEWPLALEMRAAAPRGHRAARRARDPRPPAPSPSARRRPRSARAPRVTRARAAARRRVRAEPLRDGRRRGRAREHDRVRQRVPGRACRREPAPVRHEPRGCRRRARGDGTARAADAAAGVVGVGARRRPGSPTSTRSARGSGTRSTPTARSRARAGLPEIILHGTATLALGVSRVARPRRREPGAVAARRGASGAMVPMPSTLAIRGHAPRGRSEGAARPLRRRARPAAAPRSATARVARVARREAR